MNIFSFAHFILKYKSQMTSCSIDHSKCSDNTSTTVRSTEFIPFYFRLSESEYRQLIGNIDELIDVHRSMNGAIEETSKFSPRDQRLGKILLHHGSKIKAAHKAYWSNHPKAVCILEKHREKLDKMMEGNFEYISNFCFG